MEKRLNIVRRFNTYMWKFGLGKRLIRYYCLMVSFRADREMGVFGSPCGQWGANWHCAANHWSRNKGGA
jgi:hypothetical protein